MHVCYTGGVNGEGMFVVWTWNIPLFPLSATPTPPPSPSPSLPPRRPDARAHVAHERSKIREPATDRGQLAADASSSLIKTDRQLFSFSSKQYRNLFHNTSRIPQPTPPHHTSHPPRPFITILYTVYLQFYIRDTQILLKNYSSIINNYDI